MKIRETFTVVREHSTRRSVEDFEGHVSHVQDETGEFLYGGSCGSEKITVVIEHMTPSGKWKKFK